MADTSDNTKTAPFTYEGVVRFAPFNFEKGVKPDIPSLVNAMMKIVESRNGKEEHQGISVRVSRIEGFVGFLVLLTSDAYRALRSKRIPYENTELKLERLSFDEKILPPETAKDPRQIFVSTFRDEEISHERKNEVIKMLARLKNAGIIGNFQIKFYGNAHRITIDKDSSDETITTMLVFLKTIKDVKVKWGLKPKDGKPKKKKISPKKQVSGKLTPAEIKIRKEELKLKREELELRKAELELAKLSQGKKPAKKIVKKSPQKRIIKKRSTEEIDIKAESLRAESPKINWSDESDESTSTKKTKKSSERRSKESPKRSSKRKTVRKEDLSDSSDEE